MEGTNPKDLIGAKKVPLALVPQAGIIHTAMAMKNGQKKYGAYNWRKNPVKMTIYIEAAQRHLAALLDGEDVASDSQSHHAAHAAACMMILLDALETGNLVDDRPAPGKAAELLERFAA